MDFIKRHKFKIAGVCGAAGYLLYRHLTPVCINVFGSTNNCQSVEEKEKLTEFQKNAKQNQILLPTKFRKPGRPRVALMTGSLVGVGKDLAKKLCRLNIDVYVCTRNKSATEGYIKQIFDDLNLEILEREKMRHEDKVAALKNEIKDIPLEETEKLEEANEDLQRIEELFEKKIADVKLKCAARKRKCHFVNVNLSNLKSVEKLVAAVERVNLPIDIVLNTVEVFNAEPNVTSQDFEFMFGVNYLSHFFLTMKLLPRLLDERAMIINVSHSDHYSSQKEDFEVELKGDCKEQPEIRYRRSKLANVLFTNHLHRKFCADVMEKNKEEEEEGEGEKEEEKKPVMPDVPHLKVVCVDHCLNVYRVDEMYRDEKLPVWKRYWYHVLRYFVKNTDDVANDLMQLIGLLEGEEGVQKSGKYFCGTKERVPSKLALDEEFQTHIWEKTNELLKSEKFLIGSDEK